MPPLSRRRTVAALCLAVTLVVCGCAGGPPPAATPSPGVAAMAHELDGLENALNESLNPDLGNLEAAIDVGF